MTTKERERESHKHKNKEKRERDHIKALLTKIKSRRSSSV